MLLSCLNLLTDILWPGWPEEPSKTYSSICVFLGYWLLNQKVSCCEEELGGAAYEGFLIHGDAVHLSQQRWGGDDEMQRCGKTRDSDTFQYLYLCLCVWNIMFERERELCQRLSGKTEPGSSADLDQPFHGKRTHAVFLFGRCWLYEFIMPLGEHSSKNQHSNTPLPPANPSIGPTFIILTFPLRGSNIKVDPLLVALWGDGGVILTVWEADCRPALVLLSVKKRDGVWLNIIKMRIN